MNIYHYTKGYSLRSIMDDGFIATESKRGINKAEKITDYVWLTEKKQYPKTALPLVYGMLETNLAMHLGSQKPHVDLVKLGQFIGGVWRFSFDSDDSRFKKWRSSNERNLIQNDIEWRRMESIANKVGDEVSTFWIATADVALEKFTLEEYVDGAWVIRLLNCSFSSLNCNSQDLI